MQCISARSNFQFNTMGKVKEKVNTLVWWTRLFNSVANRFDLWHLCFDLNTGFAPVVRLINTRSVLFRNVARLNLQFDMLDLNTRIALVVKTLPDGTFNSIWINREGIPYTVSIHEQACSILWWTRGFVSILCLAHWICSCLTYSFPQYSIRWFGMFWDYEVVHSWIKTTAKKTLALHNDPSTSNTNQTQTTRTILDVTRLLIG